MSQHHFTTPRVVYLGQAYPGRDDPRGRKTSDAPRPAARSVSDGRVPARAGFTVSATAR